jgi:hypothetical protein
MIHADDREIVELIAPDMERGPWIAGGAALKWYQGLPAGGSDIDVWFKDQESFDRLKQKMTHQKNRETSIGSWPLIEFEVKTLETWDILHVSPNAITIFNNNSKHIVQLIQKEFFDSPQKVLDTFDFEVCKVLTDGKQFLFGEHTLEDIKTKTLRVLKVTPSLVSRTIKYMTMGYVPCPELKALLVSGSVNVDFRGINDYATI